jgi:hypothetical protein
MKTAPMQNAHSHLAFAPRGAGLLCAVVWFAAGDDVLGWYGGTRDGLFEASYFMLENYFSAGETAFCRTLQDDVAGDWVEVRGDRELPLAHAPLPEWAPHELNRHQDAFVRHWLFFDDDPDAATEAAALQARELALRHANIRAERLDKLRTAAAVWRYDSPGADLHVLAYLSKRWRLDFVAD